MLNTIGNVISVICVMIFVVNQDQQRHHLQKLQLILFKQSQLCTVQTNSSYRNNINKLIKHKMWTMNLSFQNYKNILSSLNIQGEKSKKISSSPRPKICVGLLP